MSEADRIRRNLAEVNAKIEAACRRGGRRRDDVTLVAVSKTFPAAAVDLAIECGVTHVGENRVQEARDKKPEVRGAARWHLIGHLQSNKAREAVRLFDVIESVDSLDLAAKISRAAASEGKTQEVLLQVNIGREPQKSGADPDAVASMAQEVAALPALRLIGLMAIPPVGDSRTCFRALRTMRDDLGLMHLSMGMSADFEEAIEEGATLVRIGSAIFGARG